jgi:hypothetical protein
VLVVGATEEPERVDPMLALASEALRVVDLQEPSLVATPPLGIDEGAASAISVVDGTLDGVRHVATSRRPLAQVLRPRLAADAPSFLAHLFDEERERLVDDDREVTGRKPMP